MLTSARVKENWEWDGENIIDLFGLGYSVYAWHDKHWWEWELIELDEDSNPPPKWEHEAWVNYKFFYDAGAERKYIHRLSPHVFLYGDGGLDAYCFWAGSVPPLTHFRCIYGKD